MKLVLILCCFDQFANHIKKSEAGNKGSKLRKVDLKISVDTVKIEDTKTKVRGCVHLT